MAESNRRRLDINFDGTHITNIISFISVRYNQWPTLSKQYNVNK
jgi:hypothetical protein